MDNRGKPVRSGSSVRVRRGSTTGWLVGTVAVVVAVVFLLLPTTRFGAREPTRHAICANNLGQIGLAIDSYTREHGVLPPPFSVDAQGRPLHSWRVLLLANLDERDEPASIDLERHWDDPANAAAAARTIAIFRCPSLSTPPGTTTYHLVVSPDGLIRPDGSATRDEVERADRNTILAIEVPADRAVPWMRPEDVGAKALLDGSGGVHLGGTNALFVDGSCQRIAFGKLPLAVRRSFITPQADTPPDARQ